MFVGSFIIRLCHISGAPSQAGSKTKVGVALMDARKSTEDADKLEQPSAERKGSKTSSTNVAREKKTSRTSSQMSSEASATAVYRASAENLLKSGGPSRRGSAERTPHPYIESVEVQDDDIQTQVAFDAKRHLLDAEQSESEVRHFETEAERSEFEAEQSRIEAEQIWIEAERKVMEAERKEKAKQKEPKGSFQIIMMSDDEAEVPPEEPELVELSARREKKAQERAEKQRKAEGRAWIEGKDKDSISQGSEDSQKSGKGQVYQSLASPRTSHGAVKPRPSSAYRSERQDVPDSSRRTTEDSHPADRVMYPSVGGYKSKQKEPSRSKSKDIPDYYSMRITEAPHPDIYTGGHILYPSSKGFKRKEKEPYGSFQIIVVSDEETEVQKETKQSRFEKTGRPSVERKYSKPGDGTQTGFKPVTAVIPNLKGERCVRHYMPPGVPGKTIAIQKTGNEDAVQTSPECSQLRIGPSLYDFGTQMHGNQIAIQTGASMRDLGNQLMQTTGTGMEAPKELTAQARPLNMEQSTGYNQVQETPGIAIQTGHVPLSAKYIPNIKGQKPETLYDVHLRDPSTQSIACQMTGNEFATQTSPGVSAFVLGPSMYDFGTQMHGNQIAIQTGSSMRDIGRGGYPCQGAGSHTLSLFTPPDSTTEFAEFAHKKAVEVTSDPVAHSARIRLTPTPSLDDSRVKMNISDTNLKETEKDERRSLPSVKSKEIEYEEIIVEDEPKYEYKTIVKEVEIPEQESGVSVVKKKGRRLSFLPNFSSPQTGPGMFGQKSRRLSYFPTMKAEETVETKSVLEDTADSAEFQMSTPSTRNEFVIDDIDPVQEVEPLTEKGMKKPKRVTPQPQSPSPGPEGQEEKSLRKLSSKSHRTSSANSRPQSSLSTRSSNSPQQNLSNNNCKPPLLLPAIDTRNMNNCNRFTPHMGTLPDLFRKSSRPPALTRNKKETSE